MPKGIYIRTKEHKRIISLGLKGRIVSKETRLKMSKANKGKIPKNLEKWRKKGSEARKGKPSWNKGLKGYNSGEKSHFWKGGITPINRIIRHSLEYKLWRTAVFERDNYTCIWCGDNKGGNLEADHIKPFALFPELRFAIDNGRTLCKTCHKTTDTYGGRERILRA